MNYKKSNIIISGKQYTWDELMEKAHDIGEDMAEWCPGYDYVLINKKTWQWRQITSRGQLVVPDSDVNWDAMIDELPHGDTRSVTFGIGAYRNFEGGVGALSWRVYPEGRYFEDEDGFGMEDNEEEMAYCIINEGLDVIVPFQPMRDVRAMLEKYKNK